MKLFFSLITLLALIVSPLFAQVSITADDLPMIGTQVTLGTATNPDIDLGSANSDPQVWDFTNLSTNNVDTITFIDPVGTDGAADFPNADVARIGTITELLGFSIGGFGGGGFGGNTTAYYSHDSSVGLIGEGIQGGLGFGDPIVLEGNPMGTYLPTGTYGDSFSSDAKYLYDIPIDTLPLPIAILIDIEKTIDIDAHGTLLVPDESNGHNVLRYNETGEVNIRVGTPIFGTIPLPLFDTTFTVQNYRFLAKEEGYPVATIAMDVADNTPLSAEFFAVAPGPDPVGFTFEEDCLTAIFTNTSDVDAIVFAWDFGDGSPIEGFSDPVHTFPDAGDYEVSLTVTLSDGTVATLTQTVTVDYCPGIDTPSNLGTVQVFPNPAKDVLNFSVAPTLANTELQINIHTIHGQVIKNQTLTVATTIDISQLSPGVYFYTLTNKEGLILKSERFLKED